PICDRFLREGWHVAIGPAGVFARGSSARIGQGGLDEENEGLLSDLSVMGSALCRVHLIRWAPEVNRRRAAAGRVLPGNGPVERPIDLEHTGSVTVTSEALSIGVREPAIVDREELA